MSQSVRSLVDHSAAVHGERTYLIDPDSNLSLTFGGLRTRCQQLSDFLSKAGLDEPAKVGFLMDNGYWTAVVMLGTIYSGHVTVPLNAVASKANLRHALRNAQVEIVFVSENYRELLADILGGENLKSSIREIAVHSVDGIDGIDAPREIEPRPLKSLSGSSTGMILHTSGTVGLPKGAVLTHANMIAGGHNVALAHQLAKEDIAYCVLPLYHINGQIVTCIAPLVSGSAVVMPHKFSARQFWTHVKQYQCSWISIVPTMAKYLLDHAHKNGFAVDSSDLQRLRMGRSASSAMPAGMHADFEKTFNIPMLETMGLTETAAPILANPLPPAKRIAGSVGIAFGNQVKVVDEKNLEMPVGQAGQIVVKGDNVIREYYNDTEATQSAFTEDGWFATGDLGYQDENGYFFITGRIKELIIKGGENISPREIDDVLYHHSAVREAGAFGFPDEAYGQEIAVAVALKDGQSCSESELIEFCNAELGQFRSPKRIFFMDDLPKGPSGKIQRLQVANTIIAQMSASR